MLKIKNDEIKLIISDFDGTLRSYQKNIVHPKDILALQKAVKNGAIFVINTGNVPYEMKKAVEMITPISSKNKYLICCNGNGIKNYWTGECEVKLNFDHPTLLAILQELEKFDLHYDITSADLEYIYYTNPVYKQSMIDLELSQEDYLHRLDLTPKVLKNFKQCPKITLHDVKLEDRKKVVETVKKAFPHLKIYATWFKNDGVDFGLAGSDKYTGILNLIKIINQEQNLHLTPDNVVYFGDHHNDFEVFKNLKYAVAVDNAIPEIKALAYEISSSVDEAGIATFLDKITC